MKFANLLILTILALLSVSLAKKSHKKHKRTIDNVPSQYTRNYRKPFADPSANPLPKEYYTGPLTNAAPIAPAKYQAYNRYISNENNYLDTTGMNIERANGKPVAQKLSKKRRFR